MRTLQICNKVKNVSQGIFREQIYQNRAELSFIKIINYGYHSDSFF